MNVAVAPSCRRRGLARWLVSFALEKAARAGARRRVPGAAGGERGSPRPLRVSRLCPRLGAPRILQRPDRGRARALAGAGLRPILNWPGQRVTVPSGGAGLLEPPTMHHQPQLEGLLQTRQEAPMPQEPVSPTSVRQRRRIPSARSATPRVRGPAGRAGRQGRPERRGAGRGDHAEEEEASDQGPDAGDRPAPAGGLSPPLTPQRPRAFRPRRRRRGLKEHTWNALAPSVGGLRSCRASSRPGTSSSASGRSSRRWTDASLEAAPLIGGAVVLDMLDGRIARLTNTQSEFGAEYDSLADAVSFGVAPALLAYCWALAARAAGRLAGGLPLPRLRGAAAGPLQRAEARGRRPLLRGSADPGGGRAGRRDRLRAAGPAHRAVAGGGGAGDRGRPRPS